MGVGVGGGNGAGEGAAEVRGGWLVTTFLFLLTGWQAVLLPWIPLILNTAGFSATGVGAVTGAGTLVSSVGVGACLAGVRRTRSGAVRRLLLLLLLVASTALQVAAVALLQQGRGSGLHSCHLDLPPRPAVPLNTSLTSPAPPSSTTTPLLLRPSYSGPTPPAVPQGGTVNREDVTKTPKGQRQPGNTTSPRKPDGTTSQRQSGGATSQRQPSGTTFRRPSLTSNSSTTTTTTTTITTTSTPSHNPLTTPSPQTPGGNDLEISETEEHKSRGKGKDTEEEAPREGQEHNPDNQSNTETRPSPGHDKAPKHPKRPGGNTHHRNTMSQAGRDTATQTPAKMEWMTCIKTTTKRLEMMQATTGPRKTTRMTMITTVTLTIRGARTVPWPAPRVQSSRRAWPPTTSPKGTPIPARTRNLQNSHPRKPPAEEARRNRRRTSRVSPGILRAGCPASLDIDSSISRRTTTTSPLRTHYRWATQMSFQERQERAAGRGNLPLNPSPTPSTHGSLRSPHHTAVKSRFLAQGWQGHQRVRRSLHDPGVALKPHKPAEDGSQPESLSHDPSTSIKSHDTSNHRDQGEDMRSGVGVRTGVAVLLVLGGMVGAGVEAAVAQLWHCYTHGYDEGGVSYDILQRTITHTFHLSSYASHKSWSGVTSGAWAVGGGVVSALACVVGVETGAYGGLGGVHLALGACALVIMLILPIPYGAVDPPRTRRPLSLYLDDEVLREGLRRLAFHGWVFATGCLSSYSLTFSLFLLQEMTPQGTALASQTGAVAVSLGSEGVTLLTHRWFMARVGLQGTMGVASLCMTLHLAIMWATGSVGMVVMAHASLGFSLALMWITIKYNALLLATVSDQEREAWASWWSWRVGLGVGSAVWGLCVSGVGGRIRPLLPHATVLAAGMAAAVGGVAFLTRHQWRSRRRVYHTLDLDMAEDGDEDDDEPFEDDWLVKRAKKEGITL
ncbi:uncharacterized protein [Panulirus ornatus]|uniref:uncharacterized protein n=1 Tax=Panulirus ornatus TaxID=150431 RepID=UPI003A886F42